MIRVAIFGYGNIGRAAEKAALAASDMQLVGVFHHDEMAACISAHPDVAILCLPTRETEQYATALLEQGISTVDSFDIHTQILDLRQALMPVAKTHKAVSIISAGWDPGTDSVIRCLMLAMTPQGGTTYTNFGPGRSMGHTVAAKAVPGVKNALSITLPKGQGIHGRHVYIEIEDGYRFEDVRDAILHDDYFAHDETEVELVPSVDALNTTKHGVNLVRCGVSGVTDNQSLEWNMHIDNPALTGQVLVSSARAAVRLVAAGQYGAYTLPEVPPISLIEGNLEQLIRQLV